MLTVACLRSPSARYYLSEAGGVARLGPVAVGGTWVGCSTQALGLAGPVDRATLERLLEGRQPVSERPLRAGRGVGVHGYDLCFSAPKSVSVLFGTASLEVATAVVSAHRRAVAGALGYVERRAVAARRVGAEGERNVLAVDGLLGAAFVHTESRAGDPHLHSHVVVANLVHGADGRWSVADGRGLFAHAAAAGALYEAELRAGVARLGLAFERRADGRLELGGADPALLAAFSGRRAEIAEDLWRHGGGSWRARRVAWAATRPEKGPPIDPMVSRAAWRRRAAAITTMTPQREVPVVLDTDRPRPPAALDERYLAAELALLPAVPRRAVVRAWAGAVAQGCPAADVEACVEQWWPSDGPGVTERRGAPSAVLAGPHLVALLGPRPARPGAQPVWRRGAEDVERYRIRWGAGALRELSEGAARFDTIGPAHLADLMGTRRRLEEARRRLGRGVPVRPEVARGLER